MTNVIISTADYERQLQREKEKDEYIAELEKANAFLNKQIEEYNDRFVKEKK